MKQEILFITHQLPFPPNSGGKIVTWEIVNFLSERFDLTLGCLIKPGEKEFIDPFRAGLSLTRFFSQDCYSPRSFHTLLGSYLRCKPLSIHRNYSKSFEDLVARFSRTVPILFCDHLEMSQYIPVDFSGKVILLEHNAEFMLWRRRANIEKNFLKKIFIYMESTRLRKFEFRSHQNSDTVLFLSDADKRHCSGAGGDKFSRITVGTGGTRSLLKTVPVRFSETEKKILFVGTLSWDANSDGLAWFLNRVWRRVKHSDPEVVLEVIGGGADRHLLSLLSGDPRIKIFHCVDHIEPHYQTSRAFIAPLRYGSGIKIKIIDAFYRGLPVVTTSIGAEGIHAKHGRDFLVADSPSDFAKNVLRLIHDRQGWERMRKNSMDFSVDHFSWDLTLKAVGSAVRG